MPTIVVTGVSGSGRIELLEDLRDELIRRDKTAAVYDVGARIFGIAKELRIKLTDQKVLDLDRELLASLRRNALSEVRADIAELQAEVFNLVGIHATFRWKKRIISGITYHDLLNLGASMMINVVDDVNRIYDHNLANPKWEDTEAPGIDETNNWIMEEEFVTEVLADVLDVPMFIVGRNHRLANLADLILTSKPKAYLSYPITHIKADHPDLLERIGCEVLPFLEQKFVVFDPLVIKDMELASTRNDLPSLVEQLTASDIEVLGSRTVARDFQLIDQSDVVIVVYLTEKLSPGVLSEIIYAGRHNKPVLMVFPYTRSPFLTEYVTRLFGTIDELGTYLNSDEFALRFGVGS